VIAKVCGITRLGDALHAARHGATALGFVFWPASPRYIAPDVAAGIVRELPPGVTPIGVFVNQSADEIARVAASAGVATIQLHGDESPEHAATVGRPVWRALSLAAALNGALSSWPLDITILLDAHDPVRRGGTGQPIDWTRAAEVARRRRVVLAGGLTPDNVQHAIATVRPFGVDVSSGVEEAPGVKDFEKVALFLERAKAGFDAH
jgi:phosphoribosylanthranilate isomerase